jgi:hypothetical protein
MNKRIKELAEQTKFHMEVSNDPNSKPSWWGCGHNDSFEKFAELIVKECVKNMENCDGDLDFAIYKTKDYFGVK